jgi:hypothetical protein
MEEGDGLPPPGNYRVVESRFVSWDYRGKAEPVLALRWKLVGDDQQPREQYYSAGKLDRFMPSPDGLRALPVSTATHFQKSTNVSVLMMELLNAQFPETVLAQDDASRFEGLYAFFTHIRQQRRSGLDQEGARERMLLIPAQIHALPGQPMPTVPPPAPLPPLAPPQVPQQGELPLGPPPVQSQPVASMAARAVDLNEPLNAQVVALANSLIQNGPFTRAALVESSFHVEAISKADEEVILNYSYTDEFKAAMAAIGLHVDGETISR